MQVNGAPGGFAFTYRAVFDLPGMVAAHKVQRDIQRTDDKFEIEIRKISAANDKIHIRKSLFYLGAINQE